MKNLILITALSLFSLNSFSQAPQRQLPNQFRDYVDFRMSQEKPNIEHKDGKVIITMSEEAFRKMQFRRMQMARMNRRNIYNYRRGNGPIFERHPFGAPPIHGHGNFEKENEKWETTKPQK